MKYKRYVLRFDGDPAVVAFLKRHVDEQHASLGKAREKGRCAKALFGVEYKVRPITLPKPAQAERPVKSL